MRDLLADSELAVRVSLLIRSAPLSAGVDDDSLRDWAMRLRRGPHALPERDAIALSDELHRLAMEISLAAAVVFFPEEVEIPF